MTEVMIRHRAPTVQSSAAVSLLFTGDLVLDVPDADYWLSGIAPALRAADVAIGHLEVPHTLSRTELAGDVPAPGAPPANLEALPRAGFAAVTLAGNHIADCGAEGISDTIHGLERLGIAYTGAGDNSAEAARPAFLEAGGRRIAVLSYNCVGPEAAWATQDRAGCNYLRVQTADGRPVAPAAPLETLDPSAYERLQADIAAARTHAQLIIVALHKGIVHTPATLAPYERPLAEAAVRAGADIVIGHHAHILRGIEFVQRRPVFHGLGNGCVVTHALTPSQDHPARAEWAARRRKLFGFEPDPDYPLAPFHPEAVHALLGLVRWHPDGSLETGGIPVFIEPPGRPVLADASRSRQVIDYVDRITRQAGLPALRWTQNGNHWTCEP
jgi:poly-gamma-glutamate capsule biosynthesis protein CapA/YwtB (metallophosphatase superfamily)